MSRITGIERSRYEGERAMEIDNEKKKEKYIYIYI